MSCLRTQRKNKGDEALKLKLSFGTHINSNHSHYRLQVLFAILFQLYILTA
ncbi:hypothetical protein GCM10009193_22680 [Shewanella aestuarii]|jgi:hypothetical protein|nr:hypothetical protein GCM10009193_22680 [Shewanella aestuarii]